MRGFTLIELFFVVAIIAILAALLLPALEQARSRTRQTQCLSQLKQLGLAWHAFAHDHDGLFPFQTPTNAGGTFGMSGDLATHFRPISNELGVVSLLWCPADRERVPAESFAKLQVHHLSYFLRRTSGLNESKDVLAGDRNLDLSVPERPRWLTGLHDRRGNLLFGDAHVEKSTGGQLPGLFPTPDSRANVVLPIQTPSGPGSSGPPSGPASGPSGPGGSSPRAPASASTTPPANYGGAPSSGSVGAANSSRSSGSSGAAGSREAPRIDPETSRPPSQPAPDGMQVSMRRRGSEQVPETFVAEPPQSSTDVKPSRMEKKTNEAVTAVPITVENLPSRPTGPAAADWTLQDALWWWLLVIVMVVVLTVVFLIARQLKRLYRQLRFRQPK